MGMQCCCKKPISKEEAVGAIITSIAMEESALAHILNAESEKLLEVVNTSGASSAQLMAVNESVKNTINAINKLEMLLQLKLSLFKDTVCE